MRRGPRLGYAPHMKRRSSPRPAFVVTTVALVSCSGGTPSSSSTPPDEPRTLTAADLPIRDGEGHVIFRKGDGCYVQVAKEGEPDPPLMSGEMWVEDKTIDCPAAFADPAFSLPEGHYLTVNGETGECISRQNYGNPPPPGSPTPCPAFVERAAKPAAE